MKLMGKFITGIFSLLLIAAAWAGTKEAPGQTVDSGSFAILVNGQRVATEKFNIQQTATGSTINSELREDASTEKASQTSSMKNAPTISRAQASEVAADRPCRPSRLLPVRSMMEYPMGWARP